LYITYRDKEWQFSGKRRVRDVIEEIGLVPHAVLAVREGKLLTEDVMLNDDDEVRLISVISGGAGTGEERAASAGWPFRSRRSASHSAAVPGADGARRRRQVA